MQIGDRLVLVRTLDGQMLVGKIHGSKWEDDPDAGSFTLHWPMLYEERPVEKDGQAGFAFGFFPPSEVFALDRLEVRFASRCILSDEAVKRIGQLYERTVKTQRAKDTGLVVPEMALQ